MYLFSFTDDRMFGDSLYYNAYTYRWEMLENHSLYFFLSHTDVRMIGKSLYFINALIYKCEMLENHCTSSMLSFTNVRCWRITVLHQWMLENH